MLVKNSLEKVTIKFSGDSGDGIQLLGSEFTQTSAVLGNDLGTFPDFPAEIRAPVGTTAGISGFQIQLGSVEVNSPGDEVDALVALNPAALKANLPLVKKNGVIILNTHNFDEKGLKLAGIKYNPLKDNSLKSYRIFALDITKLNRKTLLNLDMKPRARERCKNFYVLGILVWLYNRSLERTLKLTQEKFFNQKEIMEANALSLKAGYAYAEASELFINSYHIPSANLSKGTYRHITGNEALSLGLLTFFHKSKIKTIYASYPITPASDILNYVKKFEKYGLVSLQAEDEMSAAGIALGASFAGGIGVTASSGPGITLKIETINLAVMTELPLLIINVQRAGPSTGMPTKMEQGDLLQSFFGRHGESSLPIIAPTSANDCFFTIIKALNIAIKYMTPVMILSDGYLANGSEPWKIPFLNSINVYTRKKKFNINTFAPYLRDPQTLARPWAYPGMKGYTHRIGGLEKKQITGEVNYDGENHEIMSKIRKQKIANVVQEVPNLKVEGNEKSNILIMGWGSTYGTIKQAVIELKHEGYPIAHVQIKYLNPFPANLEKIINQFSTIIIAEINFGQLAFLIKGKFLKNIISHCELKGKPLNIKKIKERIKTITPLKKNI